VVELGEGGGLRRAAVGATGCTLASLGAADALHTFLEAHVPSRRLARVAASNTLLASLFAAAPGTVEIAQLDAIERHSREYDRVIIDGEASGHALLWLELPSTFAGLGAAGVLGQRLGSIEALLHDPQRFVVHAAVIPRALVERETRMLAEGIARLGIARGAVLATDEPIEASTDALRAALDAFVGQPAEEDLRYALAARLRIEAMREAGACGFSRSIEVPFLERGESWMAQLAARGEQTIRQLEASA
jgi:anion-transporting  ArsA/GET3 family ATPase